MILADTNVMLRIFLRDDAAQLKAVWAYVDRAARDHQSLLVHELSIAEMVWVLDRKGWSREQIVDSLLELCADPHFIVRDEEVVKAALAFFLEANVSFIDAFQGAYANAHGLKGILSFDRGFDGLGVRRIDPKGN